MASNVQKLAAQLRDIYTAGFPDAEARLSTPRALLLVTQVAAQVRLQNFREMYRDFGVHMVNGQFVKEYELELVDGGTNFKKCALPAAVLALPTNRGIAYVLGADGLTPIELLDKSTYMLLSGGITQATGKDYALPVGNTLEIRGACPTEKPVTRNITVGMVVPDESQVDEASDFVILDKCLALLRQQPYPDMNVNANPQ